RAALVLLLHAAAAVRVRAADPGRSGHHPGAPAAALLLVLRLLVRRRAADLQLGRRKDAVDAAPDHFAAGAAGGPAARPVVGRGLGSTSVDHARPGDRWADPAGDVRAAGLDRPGGRSRGIARGPAKRDVAAFGPGGHD